MRVDVPESLAGAAGPLEQARATFRRLAGPVAVWESEPTAAAGLEWAQAPASEEVVRRFPVPRLRWLAAPSELLPAREHELPRRTPGVRRVLPAQSAISPVRVRLM